MFVRVPPATRTTGRDDREEADERQRGEGGKSFNLSRVHGTAPIWDDAADSARARAIRGTVELPGDAAADVLAARMHWWVLPTGAGDTDVSSRTASGGSVAILYQNELHDWRIGGAANPFFARLGVIFGKTEDRVRPRAPRRRRSPPTSPERTSSSGASLSSSPTRGLPGRSSSGEDAGGDPAGS